MPANRIDVTMYKFTGWQGIFKIPERWCQECDLLVRATERAIKDTGREVNFQIKPWFLWFWKPLFQHRAWHAPILIIENKLISQGIVPDDSVIKEAINESRS